MATLEWQDSKSIALDWSRSFSEPDLTGPHRHTNRFTIKNPHEYIAIDDLKFYRRKQPTDCYTRSNIYLYNSDEPPFSFSSLKTEYRKHFCALDLSNRPPLLKRAASLHLEGLMQLKSEHQEQYHWFTPEDWKFSRTYPIRNPGTLHLSDNINMQPEYRSSFLTYPMIDRSMKILPREMFTNENMPDDKITKSTKIEAKKISTEFDVDTPLVSATSATSAALAAKAAPASVGVSKLAEDKFKRDLAAREQYKCHLQLRDVTEHYDNPTPSEYKRQFVKFPIEKAHSIPQISNIKMQDGKFVAVPEYQDSFKMYANYSKSAPIKKTDNLRISGAEVQAGPSDTKDVPEYRDKFNNPPKNVPKEKLLKTNDHLYPHGEFTKDVPEYYESFRDPQIKEMPERGKCREPYLRLKGKIEFNPEYRNTYLDFPRSRPIVRKPISNFRLPISTSSTAVTRYDYRSSSPQQQCINIEPITTSEDLKNTPEYRRAQYNYRLRERTPPRKINESDAAGNRKFRKSSDSSLEALERKPITHKRRQSRQRQLLVSQVPQMLPQNFENESGNRSKKPVKFGRRASVLQNAANCRENSSIIEGNPKYSLDVSNKHVRNHNAKQESFVVLDEPCTQSNWMKKTWYDS